MFTSTPTLTIVATSGKTCSTVWLTTSSQRRSGRRTGSIATVVSAQMTNISGKPIVGRLKAAYFAASASASSTTSGTAARHQVIFGESGGRPARIASFDCGTAPQPR